jgi:hypothetical protein
VHPKNWSEPFQALNGQALDTSRSFARRLKRESGAEAAF